MNAIAVAYGKCIFTVIRNHQIGCTNLYLCQECCSALTDLKFPKPLVLFIFLRLTILMTM